MFTYFFGVILGLGNTFNFFYLLKKLFYSYISSLSSNSSKSAFYLLSILNTTKGHITYSNSVLIILYIINPWYLSSLLKLTKCITFIKVKM